MSKTPKAPSVFSSALQLFGKKPASRKPVKTRTRSARKASAKVLTNRRKNTKPNMSSAYRAASIEFEDCACDAVKELAGKRLLVSEIPKTPLADCTSPNCKCTYVRYSDRRSEYNDRRSFTVMRGSNLYTQTGNKERRRTEDRRKSDSSNYGASEVNPEFEKWCN
jgi:Tfp pilus assembly protein PilW